MRRLRLALVLCLLTAAPCLPAQSPRASPEGLPRGESRRSRRGAEKAAYRLEYQIRGGAISRVLLLFPLRVFYEASVAVDLTARRQEDGSICFAYAGLPAPAYILRTLGFGGKTLALLTVGGDEVGTRRSPVNCWPTGENRPPNSPPGSRCQEISPSAAEDRAAALFLRT